MHCVTERIKDSGYLQRNAYSMPPDIGHRQDDEFHECTGTVDADSQLKFAASSEQAIPVSRLILQKPA